MDIDINEATIWRTIPTFTHTFLTLANTFLRLSGKQIASTKQYCLGKFICRLCFKVPQYIFLSTVIFNFDYVFFGLFAFSLEFVCPTESVGQRNQWFGKKC